MQIGTNTYFTGVPCKNGHISQRYVKSGACYDCLKSMRKKIDPETSPRAIARKERLETTALAMQEQFAEREVLVARARAREQLVIVKLRLFPVERDGISLIAYGMAAMRNPILSFRDIDPKLPTIGVSQAGTQLYQFFCFPDDIESLRFLANESCNKHTPDFTKIREELHRTALEKYAPSNEFPPMLFK